MIRKYIGVKPNNFNPIPTRLCHMIYCHGNKSYYCLVGIVLNCIANIFYHYIQRLCHRPNSNVLDQNVFAIKFPKYN